MRILLDTHILLWALVADEKLPKVARQLIEDEKNDLFFSLASVWEVEIKYGLGKMPISGMKFYENCVAAGYNPLKVEVEHIALLSTLKRSENSPKHNDPFDRMLIAQSKKEGIKFMTHDELIPQYNEDCVLAV